MGAIVSLIERVNSHIRSGLLSWLREWLPDGKIEGHEFIAKNPRRADGKHGSFKVNVNNCVWRDFALNEKGGNDPVSLYAYVRSLPMGEAARELAQKIGGSFDDRPAPRAQATPPAENWSIVLPVPPDCPELPKLSPMHWIYRDAAGEFLGVIERINRPGGGKDFLPWTLWKNGEGVLQWKRKNFPDPRPMYGLDLLAKNKKGAVLIVEGEKACEAARKLVPWAICVSWPGGANACQKVDWSPLKGRAVAIWPDADGAGLEAAEKIAGIIHGQAQYAKIVHPPEDVEKGWDLYDGLQEKWSVERVKAHIKDHSFIWEPPANSSSSVEKIETASVNKTEAVDEAARQEVIRLPDPPPPEYDEEEFFEEDEDEGLLGDGLFSTTADRYDTSLGKHSKFSLMAQRAVADKILYDEFSQKWFEFEKIWREVSEGHVERALLVTLDRMFPQGYNANLPAGILRMMRTRLGRSPKIDNNSVALSDWSSDKKILPMQNGVLNIETRELAPHAPAMMMNWILPYEYKPGSECPTIMQLLDNISQDDPNNKVMLLCFLGAIFYGMNRLQKYLELVGKPGSGKSTFMKIATELIGHDNMVSTTMENLSKNRFETATLYGKRLVIIPDADAWAGSVEVFKSITGQDPIRYETKGVQQKRPFIFEGMVIVSANAPLQFTDHSTAMARRRVPVHIDKRFDERRADPNLDMKIKAEIPGLVNMLLDMDQTYIEKILRDTEGARLQASRRALVETNVIAEWLDERCILELGCETKIGGLERAGQTIVNWEHYLYPNFCQFLESNGRRQVVSLTRFSAAVMEVAELCGHQVKKIKNNKGIHLTGVRLRRLTDHGGRIDAGIQTPLTAQTIQYDSDPELPNFAPGYR